MRCAYPKCHVDGEVVIRPTNMPSIPVHSCGPHLTHLVEAEVAGCPMMTLTLVPA